MEKGEAVDAKAVEMLERQAERLHALLDEMLEVSRHEVQRFVLHQEACDLGELVESALRSVRRLGLEGEIRVERPGPLPLIADRERIERAICALVLRARSLGDPITVRAERAGARAELRIAWSGAPLNFHERAEAFEPRWEEPQSARLGLGMSLFIARHAVGLHAGELRAEPDAFVLVLPLRAET
jgi:two-component system sensor histidine kinase MtrB